MTARAEPLLREALARKQNRLGREHPDFAEVMSILSAALDRLGTYAESEQLMRGALAINAKAYTGPNSHVAGNINNLANVLVLEGRFGEAEQQYAQSLTIDHELAPSSAFDEATTVGNLARLRFRQGAYAEAEAGLRDAVERKQKQLAPITPTTVAATISPAWPKCSSHGAASTRRQHWPTVHSRKRGVCIAMPAPTRRLR